jgi:hypothetical protein
VGGAQVVAGVAAAARHKIHQAPGTHTVTAELTDSFDNPLNPLVGYKVGVNTVTATTGQGS